MDKQPADGSQQLYDSFGFRRLEERREQRSGQLLTEEKRELQLLPDS